MLPNDKILIDQVEVVINKLWTHKGQLKVSLAVKAPGQKIQRFLKSDKL